MRGKMQTQISKTAPRISTGESTGSAKKTNPDRFSGKAFHAVRRYSRTRGNHRLFMLTVSGTWASDEGLAWPAHSTIAESMNCSVRLVGDLQRELIEMGELEITGTSKLGTNILRLVCVREGENFRPKKVSQKAEPKPRRKKLCTPPVQVQQSTTAKSADKEPENFPSPSISPDPCISEEPVLKPGRKTNTSNRVEAPPLQSPALSPQVSNSVLKTGGMQATPEQREKWAQELARYISPETYRLRMPLSKQQRIGIRNAINAEFLPYPRPGTWLAAQLRGAV